jgi:hypothetical protein
MKYYDQPIQIRKMYAHSYIPFRMPCQELRMNFNIACVNYMEVQITPSLELGWECL